MPSDSIFRHFISHSNITGYESSKISGKFTSGKRLRSSESGLRLSETLLRAPSLKDEDVQAPSAENAGDSAVSAAYFGEIVATDLFVEGGFGNAEPPGRGSALTVAVLEGLANDLLLCLFEARHR
jgi:hypothetical protein